MPTSQLDVVVKPEDHLDSYTPTPEEVEVLNLIREDWLTAYDQKVRPFRCLNEDSLENFWQKSRDHFNGYNADVDTGVNGWKSKAFKKKTRHKVIATIAGFVQSGIGLDFSAMNPERKLDRVMSKTVEDLYEWSLEREGFDYKQFLAYHEQAIAGTVHLYEEIAWDERQVKEISSIDFKTGKVVTEEKTRTEFKGCRSEVVPNDEMFPLDVYTHDIQEQPAIIRRKLTTKSAAEKVLNRWENWPKVMGGRTFFLPTSSISEIERESIIDTLDDDLEIIFYWRKDKDLFAIVANGVLLTPPDYPIPYPHKQYPFSKGIFELFADTRFYWGDSLPNKNWDDQDMVNQLWRMFMDSTKLKSKPPLFTNVPELVNTDLVVPGLVAGIEEREFTVTSVEQAIQGVSVTEYNMLQRAEGQIDENSVSPVTAGQSTQNDATATEVNAVVGSAEKMKGYDEQYISNWMIQHAHLRIPNMLWFLTHDEEYKEVVIDQVKTHSGETGKRKINFVAAADMPTSDQLWTAEEVLESENKSTDFVFVDKDSVNDYRFHISMSATPKPRRTSTQKMTRQIQKYRFYAQNQLIDQKVNTQKLVEALGDDPDEMMSKPASPALAGGMGTQPAPATSGLPAQDNSMAPQQNVPEALAM